MRCAYPENIQPVPAQRARWNRSSRCRGRSRLLTQLDRSLDRDTGSPLIRSACRHAPTRPAAREDRNAADGGAGRTTTTSAPSTSCSGSSTALAARSGVPVELIIDLPERPSAAIETIAYFCAAELLTNVAKHSGARHATLEAVHVTGLLRVRVSDDGSGGARLE